jgi:hypothetical protein
LEAQLNSNQAVYTIGIVAAWMQMEGLLPNGVSPDWKSLERTLCVSKPKKRPAKLPQDTNTGSSKLPPFAELFEQIRGGQCRDGTASYVHGAEAMYGLIHLRFRAGARDVGCDSVQDHD